LYMRVHEDPSRMPSLEQSALILRYAPSHFAATAVVTARAQHARSWSIPEMRRLGSSCFSETNPLTRAAIRATLNDTYRDGG
jgi:hypothetical protein